MEDNTELHRQIHPSFVVNDQVSNLAFSEDKFVIASVAFNPTEKDNNKLSVYNGLKFTPEASFEHYSKQYTSCGTLTVIVKEVNDIPALDCSEDNIPFDGHSYIDFTNVSSKNQKSKAAGKLRDVAVKRGWTYKP